MNEENFNTNLYNSISINTKCSRLYNPQNGMYDYLNWNVLENGISDSLSIE